MKPELDTSRDYYEILGVSRDTPQDEVKRAYRKLARETHPDTGGDSATFQILQAAYAVLSDSAKRQTYDLLCGTPVSTPSRGSSDKHSESGPEAESVVINGASVRVSYERMYWYGDKYRAMVGIFESDLSKIDVLPEFAAPLGEVLVYDENGDLLCSSYSLEGARDRLERARREAERLKRERETSNKLASYGRKLESMKKRDLPTSQLATLIAKAANKAAATRFMWSKSEASTLISLFHAIDKELERLNGDPADVIRDYFMSGKIEHRDIEHNRKVVERLEELSVRTDGLIDVPSNETIQRHYEACLRGVTTLSDLELLDLRLRFEDYAPRDVVDSLDELDPAPAKIELRASKGTSWYTVSYHYEQTEAGGLAPVGVVRIPLSTFQKNAPEHGKKSNFPELPYGIQLAIEVTPNGDPSRVVAAGLATPELTKKVDKFARAQGRSKLYGTTDELGFRRTGPNMGTAVPPWFVGRPPRAR